jgi:transcriptional antiterminator NusG
MEWYSLRVISGKEKNTQEDIMREISDGGVSDQVTEVFVPFEKVVAMRNNKKIVKDKMFFPGYILINMEMTAQSRYVVENSPGVIRFVGPKGREPVPLRENEIKRIFGEVERKEGKEILAAPFKVGDPVKVIAGPFIDFTGLVEEIFEEKQKVKVEVSIFGRPTPIELDFFQVEIEK